MTSLPALPAGPLAPRRSTIRIAVDTCPPAMRPSPGRYSVDAPAPTDHAAEREFAKSFIAALLGRWVLPAVLLVGVTLLLTYGGIDIALSRLFYSGVISEEDWAGQSQEPWHALYRLGPAPGLILGIAGAVVGFGSFVVPRWRPYRSAGLFLAVFLALGPGMLVNGVLKPNWGRPRPCQIVEFGGDQAYLPCWQSGSHHRSRSFPSGHASMGFFLIAPAFLLYRSHRRAALGFVILGVVVGGSIGLARIVQGRHFPSDVLWSLGCVYFCGLTLSAAYWQMIQWHQSRQQQPALALASSASVRLESREQTTNRELLDDEPFPATISIETAHAASARPPRQQSASERRRRAA